MASNERPATPGNGTMLQAFEWYVSNDGKHLQRLTKDMSILREMGITASWLPPSCKANAGTNDVGYGIYDLWDLGEFDQKGAVRTKYGTIQDLLALSDEAESSGMRLYFDAVLNHKAGADKQERCRVQQVESADRLHDVGSPKEIDAWVGFDFKGEFTSGEGRGTMYSDMQWHWYHFDGTDGSSGEIYRILGKDMYWAPDVDSENGNYDYLMFADIDHRHPEVRAELMKWGLWVSKRLRLEGMRFDAVKHYSESFLLDFTRHLTENHGDFFCVGEFWKDDLATMLSYLSKMQHQFSLFDTPLVYNFSEVSRGDSADLCQIFAGSLVEAKPINAVTLVANHDTQPGQALETPVTDWFKPLAYALILLRQSGYPCVFYGDLYGTLGPYGRAAGPCCGGQLGDLIFARKMYAYGEQNDYFDFRTCIGWVRRGTWDRPDGCAVVMSNAGDGWKRMYVGLEHKGEVWTDVLGWSKHEAMVGDDGFAEFKCWGCSVSVYVRDGAEGREKFGSFNGRFVA